MTGELLDGYDPEGFYDELVTPEGEVREHYRQLTERLANLSPEELSRRERLRDAAFRTAGITFTVYGEGDGLERTFPMDLIPRIIPGDEWAHIEAGLVQRVTALNQFLDDLYVGERAAVRDGIVPQWLVESSDGFERAAFGIPVPHGARCLVAGIDIVRDGNGVYRVLEDNLRNPSGISYVLENRAAMTRVLPTVFGAQRVRSVDHYGASLLGALKHVAPAAAGDPCVVVLTPGVFNSAYFEHAFLARQMGVELVEGPDLVVDEHVVFMRTTRGLQRVDVIYRRIDDAFLDPVSLRSDSILGVPGILAAARAGNVTIANALGNGVADDKAVYAYVPDLIRYYLNAEPILPNVDTYLLWDVEQRQMVLERLDELVVKPVEGSGGYGMLIGPAASDAELAEFRMRIEAEPRGYIAQEVVQLSRHPTLVGDRLEGRHIDLRPFVLSGERVEVIPGGLTRVALRKGSLVVNSSQGGGSKDTWVLDPADGPDHDGDGDGARRPKPTAKATTEEEGDQVLARHAEMLFWCGRYLERAEDTARVLDVTYHGLLESPPAEARRSWLDLLSVLGLADEFVESEVPVNAATVSEYLVLDTDNPGAIVSAAGFARENARGVRELISSEFWEAVNTFYLELRARDLRHDLTDQPYELYGLVKRRCQTVAGVASETMPRDDGWRFLMLGWMLERAEMTCRLLNVRFVELETAGDLASFPILVGVLKSASASEAYRMAFGAVMDPERVIEFLMLSPNFPRSLLYCLRQAEKDLARITAPDDLSRARRIIGRLRAQLEFCEVQDLFEAGLHTELERIQQGVHEAAEALAAQYFRNSSVELHPLEFRPAG